MSAILFETAFAPTADRDDATPRIPVDEALRAVLDRHDDRLLHDAGLTREDVLGEAGAWRETTARIRTIWDL
jgi:hypothetical protein